jgi:hypothetical protein
LFVDPVPRLPAWPPETLIVSCGALQFGAPGAETSTVVALPAWPA